MSDAVTRFYEEMYAEGRAGRPPGGLLGRLFLKLRRFELHRTPATLQLLRSGERLLDYGCGDGSLLALARASKFREVYGVDIAPAVIRRADETCTRMLPHSDGMHVQVADLNERLPFADEFFDAVTAIAVVEHVFDPYFAMREIARVLRPGAQLVLEVPNLAWLPRRLDALIGRLPVTGDEEGWDGGHLHYFTFRAVHELMTTSGFDVEYSGSTGIFHQVRNVWPQLLGGNVMISARKHPNAATH